MSTEREEVMTLEAAYVYLLMKKDYRISRNVRAQWLLSHLNTSIHVPQRQNLSELSGDLEVISIVPQDPPENWKYGTSHMYKYQITSNTTVIFLAQKYRLVYCLDISPSLSAVDTQHGTVMIDEVVEAVKKSVHGLAKPFQVPGSHLSFQPEIYITVIAHTPFFTSPAQQVLVQGWHVIPDLLEDFLLKIQIQLQLLENCVAEVSGIAQQQLDALRAESEKLVGGLFEENTEVVQSNISQVPMVHPDIGFINMLRYGMLALKLLPENSSANIIVVTDGIINVPDVNVLDSVLIQLRSSTVSCSFLQVGSKFHPHCCRGFVPYADLMQFIATATLGTYFPMVPVIELGCSTGMNVYHKAFLMWTIQKNNQFFGHLYNPYHLRTEEWIISNQCFYDTRESRLLRKKQVEDTLSTSLSNVLSCRLREGYTIKTATLSESYIEICLVLPWKNQVYIEYSVTSQWPCTTGGVHYAVSIEAPYEFLHDITCLLKKTFKSSYRQAVVSRFWSTLKNQTHTDQLLVHLYSFASNAAAYTIPESIKNGMPLFYLPSNSSTPVLTSSDFAHPQFATFWKPVCLLEPTVWQKWLHTHRIGLVLQHDHPLPRHLHRANSSGRFQIVQCRQAAATLYSMLKVWSSFVLIENICFVKLIFGEPDKPPSSFYIIHVTSKPPCVVINVAFLGGTAGNLRHQIVQQLKKMITCLTFPQRPSIKEPLIRKISSTKAQQDDKMGDRNHASVLRTWSDIRCCILLQKPVEKVLIRYERMPSDFATVIFPDGTQPFSSLKSGVSPGGGGMITTLSRYLHHRRWIWAAQNGPSCSVTLDAIARVLSTLTKMRLQEGYSFAHSASGIINMVLEVEMAGQETSVLCKQSQNAQDCDNDEEGPDIEDSDNLRAQPCIIQYILFPPHMAVTGAKESGSDDEGTDEIETTDPDGELQIITECWIEPQYGSVVNSPSERQFLNGMTYENLADVICDVDAECIASLLTFEHLILMCQSERAPSLVTATSVQSLQGCLQSVQRESEPHAVTLSERRIHYIPFTFNVMRLLPKCQQAELLFSTFIQDLTFSYTVDEAYEYLDTPNKLVFDMMFDHCKQIHDKELPLSMEDSQEFLKLLHKRERDETVYSLPIPKIDVKDKLDTSHMPSNLKNGQSPGIALSENVEDYPRWKCYIKGISVTHVILTFVPASYKDLKKLMLNKHYKKECNPKTVKFVNNITIQDDFEVRASCENLPFEKRSSADLLNEKLESETHAETQSSCCCMDTETLHLSRSSSCDASSHYSYTHKKQKFSDDLSDSSHAFFHKDVIEVPFRLRAGSLDTVTKARKMQCLSSVERNRTGSIDSPTKHQITHKDFSFQSFRKTAVSKSSETCIRTIQKKELETAKTQNSSSPPSSKKELPKNHKPMHGSVTLPVYVYDCPLAILIETLVYKETESSPSDIYDDKTFKDEVEIRDSAVNVDIGNISSVADSTTKQSSPDPKSEDSDGTSDKQSLKQHCKLLSLSYFKCFVFTLYKSLQLNYFLHSSDVQSAVDECEEFFREIDITRYIQTICGHLKDYKMKVNLENLNQFTNSKVAGSVATNEESQDGEGNHKFPLGLLQHHMTCESLKQHHSCIKEKFMKIITTYFKRVPSHEEFYFCVPNWEGEKAAEPEHGDGEECVKLPAMNEYVDNTAFHSEIVEFTTEQGTMTAPSLHKMMSWESREQDSIATGDDACTSSLSGVDSASVNGLHDEVVEEVSPLFLHLTCSVHSKGSVGSCSVFDLPTCLGELTQTLQHANGELDFNDQITLDIYCLTLPPDVDSLLSEKGHHELRTTSFCSSSPVPHDQSQTFTGSIGSSLGSVDEEFPGDGMRHHISHLPEYQSKAVATTVEEIQWLLDDEIAAFLLDVVPLQESTLDMIANHVKKSSGQMNCILDKVPLQFVFGPDQSLDRFLQEFKIMNVNGHHLKKEGAYYYLVKGNGSHRRKTHASLVPPLSIVPCNLNVDDASEFWKMQTSMEGNELILDKRVADTLSASTTRGSLDGDSINAICDRKETDNEEIPTAFHSKEREDTFQGKEESKSMETFLNLDERNVSTSETVPHEANENEALSTTASIEQSTSADDIHRSEDLQEYQSRCSSIACSSEPSKEIGDSDFKQSEVKPGAIKSDDFTSVRDTSPSRLTSASRRRHFSSAPSTPGPRSEVSSIIESGQGTEDGYEGDSSDSADECDWLVDFNVKRPCLPNFWLIMQVDQETVTSYFHCRSSDCKSLKGSEYRKVHLNVLQKIKELCKVVNQSMLLLNLHDTRMCDQLLEPESSEDIWKHNDPLTLHSTFTRMKSFDDGAEAEAQSTYLEATMKFMPGSFSCSVVWETPFILHPRLKTGPGKQGLSRGILALRSVLNRFSVNNRKNMFVYRDNSGNVYYLRLHENVRTSQIKLTPPGHGRSDGEDNSPGTVSRSSSIASLNARKQIIDDISLSNIETRPRVRSFGEKDNSMDGAVSASVVSMLKSEDTIVLKVHGISQVGPEVKEDLVEVLQNRLDDAVLEVLSVMLARNPVCKLTPDDVHFIQKPYKLPEANIKFTIHPNACDHLHAMAFYLRQNLLQFLHTPKYTDSRSEFHFQDYSQPPLSAQQVTEGDMFLYNQSPSSGSKGIACIALAITDSQGNLIHHSHFSKPSPFAHENIIEKDKFYDVTASDVFQPENNSSDSDIAALVEFRVWKQGRVNIESLTQKLKGAVCHATWDLLMEFRLLTAPLAENVSDITALNYIKTSDSTTPTMGKKFPKFDGSENFAEVTQLSLPNQSISAQTVGGNRILDNVQSSHDKDSQGIAVNKFEAGESGVLHKVYQTTMKDWLDFAIDIGVPAVKKHSVSIEARYSIAVLLRELQNLVSANAQDTSAPIFKRICTDTDEELYVPYHLTCSSQGFVHKSNQPKGEEMCFVLGRSLHQWKACIAEDVCFDPDVLYPKAQKLFQKFAPLLVTLPQVQEGKQDYLSASSLAVVSRPSSVSLASTPNSQVVTPGFSSQINLESMEIIFVPRQRFLLMCVTEKQIVIYTYNWSKERTENLSKQISSLSYWVSARASLLTSIISQKMGLFNNQEFVRKCQKRDGQNTQEINPFMTTASDVDALIKPPMASVKDYSSLIGNRHTQSHPNFLDVFRDNKPAKPAYSSSYSSSQDQVTHHGQQMLDVRNTDNREHQKKLCVMWQTRGATPNIPIAEDILELFRQHSRVIHYCLTPLLFVPRWRIQSAATRDHTLSVISSNESIQTYDIRGQPTINRSRHASGNSTKSGEGSRPNKSVNTPQTSPKLKRACDEKWHQTLCLNFVQEYIQYLQTLGFIPIQTKPASPKKVMKNAAKHKDTDEQQRKAAGNHSGQSTKQYKDETTWYLQKSLLGGILLFELLLCEPFFYAKFHALECSRLQSKSSTALMSQFTISFLDECDKIKILMHLHSFTYDYHLRSIHSYVSGRQSILRHGYHLTNFLDDFIKYYSKGPNFARNLVYSDVLTIENTTTPALQLFNYLLSHEKFYNMEVFRMVPPSQDLDTAVDNEYVLVQLRSPHRVSYRDINDTKQTDDFDVTLIVAHDYPSYEPQRMSEKTILHLKYYLILTSCRELYPKYIMEKKLGKFRTVSTTASHPCNKFSEFRGLYDADMNPTTLKAEKTEEHTLADIKTENSIPPEKQVSMAGSAIRTQISIRQEAVNYLGYYSSHEQIMQKIILEQAESAKKQIEEMVTQGMVHCRTHLLWNKLLCSVRETEDRTRRKDDNTGKEIYGLSYAEFSELLQLATVEPLSNVDSQLGPLLNQPLSWYQGLSKILTTKYNDHHRLFISPDGNIQHIVVLHPRYLEAFMMLSIDLHTSRGDLCVVYRGPLHPKENNMDQLHFSLADIHSLIEGFVNACCFHLWVGLL